MFAPDTTGHLELITAAVLIAWALMAAIAACAAALGYLIFREKTHAVPAGARVVTADLPAARKREVVETPAAVAG